MILWFYIASSSSHMHHQSSRSERFTMLPLIVTACIGNSMSSSNQWSSTAGFTALCSRHFSSPSYKQGTEWLSRNDLIKITCVICDWRLNFGPSNLHPTLYTLNYLFHPYVFPLHNKITGRKFIIIQSIPDSFFWGEINTLCYTATCNLPDHPGPCHTSLLFMQCYLCYPKKHPASLREQGRRAKLRAWNGCGT